MGSGTKYDKLGNDYHWGAAWVHGAYGAWVRRVLEHFPVEASRATVLDVGCGDGFPASVLVEQGYSVHGVDVLEGPLEVAKERVPGAKFAMTYPRKKFDYVLALESIEHMGDIRALVEAVRGCREYALISTPRSGLDPYAEKGYGLEEIEAAFEGCEVEVLVMEDEHQLFRVTRRRIERMAERVLPKAQEDIEGDE